MTFRKNLLLTLTLSSCMHAAFADTDNMSVSTLSSEGPDTSKTFDIVADYNHVARANVDHPHRFKHDHFSFSEGLVIASYNHAFSAEKSIKAGLGYMNSHMNLDSHHHARHKSFDNLLATIGGTVKSGKEVEVTGQLGMQLNTDHPTWRYSFYTGNLEAIYAYKHRSNLHVGILGVAGLRYSRMLPILGFDFQATDKWKINCIFPTKISTVYSLTKQLSCEAGFRTFLSRQRFGTDEPKHLRRGFIAYRNLGFEVAMNYYLNSTAFVNLHVGETFGGRVRLSNHHDNHRRHLKLESSPYVGFTAFVAF